MSKNKDKAAAAEEEEAANELSASKALDQTKNFANSISVVTQVLNETVLQKAAEHFYNKYL